MKKLSIFPLLVLFGCAVGPDYQTPEILVSDQWSADDECGAQEEPLQKWWEVFQDDLLNKYIELAVDHNYDIQVAEANILKARALRQVAASTLFPQVNADINGTKTYFSKNGPVFVIGQAGGNPADTSSGTTGLPYTIQIPQIQNLFNGLFDASWELDFFGRTRRAVEAAEAELDSAKEQRNSALLSVFAEIARSYIDLRSFQKRTKLIQQNIQLFEQQVDIIEARLRAGYSNQLDLETAEANLAVARAALPNAYSEIYNAIYTLSILIGNPPETLIDELFEERELPYAPTEIALGLRSDLLRRRPDIRYAERKLAEATANIGVAVASFFPTVTLLANGGFQSLVLPHLFEWGSKTWAYGADVSMPVFQGGKLFGTLHFRQADQVAAAATYQQTVLNALQDAEISLKRFRDLVDTTTDYQENILHQERLVALTQERYTKGLINLLLFIDSKKQLISSELSLLDSQTRELMALITLYKALGGGWEVWEKTF